MTLMFKFNNPLCSFFILIAALLCSKAHADINWQGKWNTVWRSGGAVLILNQNGNLVEGHYQPYEGLIKAEIQEDGSLKGTWTQPNSNGEFVFVMAKDKQSFSGSFASGEWWTGKRLKSEIIFDRPIDQSSPRKALASFLDAGNWLMSGQYTLIDNLIALSYFQAPAKGMLYRQKHQRAEAFFMVLNQLTFKLSNFPLEYSGNTYTVDVNQQGTPISQQIELTKKGDAWHVVIPTQEESERILNNLLQARGINEFSLNHDHQLSSPRHTMRYFMGLFANFEENQSEIIRTLNLKDMPEKVREWEAPLAAEYLKLIIDNIGYITWQEIPDDPKSFIKYQHFIHPVGTIEIEPILSENGKVWKFSTNTVKNIKALYDVIPEPENKDSLLSYEISAPYFHIRNFFKSLKGPWLVKIWRIEIWQWLMAIFIVLIAWHTAQKIRQFSLWVFYMSSQFFKHEINTKELTINFPITMAIVGTFWLYSFAFIGIPDYLFSPIRILSELLIITGFYWIAFAFVNQVTIIVLKLTDKTETILDDILVTVLSSSIKLFIIISGAIKIADALDAPYETVVTGLGIGGVAFAIAARETIANFFGSAVILADRPFAQGDIVQINGNMGKITSVGLRSSRLRMEDDSLVTIPNSAVSKEIIKNSSRRSRRFIDNTFQLDNHAKLESIESAIQSIKSYLQNRDDICQDFLVVGIDQVTPGIIHLRLRCYINVVKRDIYLERQSVVLSHCLNILQNNQIKLAEPKDK